MATYVSEFCSNVVTEDRTVGLVRGCGANRGCTCLNLTPRFLVFSRCITFVRVLAAGRGITILGGLGRVIVLKQRTKCFLVLTYRQPSTGCLNSKVHSRFGFHITLKHVSRLNCDVVFNRMSGSFFLGRVGKHNCISAKGDIVSRFCAPLMPGKRSFLGRVKELSRGERSKRTTYGTLTTNAS